MAVGLPDEAQAPAGRVRSVQRIPASIPVGTQGLRKIRVHGEELSGGGIVIAGKNVVLTESVRTA